MSIIFKFLGRLAFITGVVLLIGAQLGCRRCRGPEPEPEPEPAECTDRSSCGDRHYCSTDKKCICIESAEGVMRCGKIPDTCHMKLCKTSADCADLGPGYFCDTPNSGCCTDPPRELSRCVAPCESTPAAPPSLAGTWEGTSGSPGAVAVPVRLQLEAQGAKVSGKVFLSDSGGAEFFELEPVEGSHAAGTLTLETRGGLAIEAKQTGDELAGTVRFPARDDPAGPFVAQLKLKRR